MNSEKSVYKGLKWLFSFFVGVMGIAAVGLLIMSIVMNLPAVSEQLSNITVSELPFERHTIDIVSSPMFVFSMVANCILYGIVFFLVRTFFKNLENDQIFVEMNVATAKRIAVILLILSVSSCLPDLYTTMNGLTVDSSYLDLTYIVGAAIVWALAKILEKANLIAEENELTV